MPLLRFLPYSFLLASFLSSAAWAGENWGLCVAPSFTLIAASVNDANAATEVDANFMSRQSDDITYFSGEVELTQPSQRLLADELTLNNATEQAEASGHVTLEGPNSRLQADFMTMNQRDQSAYFTTSSFTLPQQHIRGTANEVFQFNSSLSRYKEIQYTHCDPGNSTWHMTANQLDINRDTGLGIARHATIYIQDLPVFYFPYLQFPIDDRRMSGILMPTIGFSSKNGDSLSVPVYWNIAPNLDATITPTRYDYLGEQLNTESRYLFKNHAGQIDLSYLDDKRINDSRWFQKWKHQSDLGSNFTADVVWRDVSDNTFFEDFKTLGESSDNVTHLERHATLNHHSERWQSSLLFQTFQTPDPKLQTGLTGQPFVPNITSRPYRRLPKLTVNSRFKAFDNGIQFNIDNEWVRFSHDSSTKVVADRTHLKPYLSWEKSASWYFFKPKLEYTFSHYQLDNNGQGANSIQRQIPIFSLDTGLFFDREMDIGTNWSQTLEPRLYFLHTPYKDQAQIPVFDSSGLSDTYDNFFKSNRFSGFDRIGDANQMALGIGTRVLDNDSGTELLYSRIGQVFFDNDRRVRISGNIPQADSRSNIISETTIKPNTNLSINTKLVYKQSTKRVSEKTLSFYYLNDDFAASLEYFYNEPSLEQATVSMIYPINPRWTVEAKYSESILLDKPIEKLFGVNYESCCWGIKIFASQTTDSNFKVTDNAVFLVLTLKGLSQIDSRVGSIFTNYNPSF